jgi:hypothetical protein
MSRKETTVPTSEHDDLQVIVSALRGDISKSDIAIAMIGYRPETKTLIRRMVELSPALTEAILKLAESAFSDGQDASDDA